MSTLRYTGPYLQDQTADPNTIEYHGFVRVHMNVQCPIHVSTAITRTSWYQLMRPVKERIQNDVDGYDVGYEVHYYYNEENPFIRSGYK